MDYLLQIIWNFHDEKHYLSQCSSSKVHLKIYSVQEKAVLAKASMVFYHCFSFFIFDLF
jgi:hypothetical protein